MDPEIINSDEHGKRKWHRIQLGLPIQARTRFGGYKFGSLKVTISIFTAFILCSLFFGALSIMHWSIPPLNSFPTSPWTPALNELARTVLGHQADTRMDCTNPRTLHHDMGAYTLVFTSFVVSH